MTAVSDDFNRGNSTSLGASWTEVSGDWEIVSNKLQCNTDAGGLGYYLRYETDVGSSDLFAEETVTSVQASANSNTGVCLRQRAAANTSYQVTGRHAGDTLAFWRIVAGAETQLTNQMGLTSLSVAWASGDRLRGEVVGNLIRAKIAGQVVGFAKDTNITDGQRVGVNGWNEVGTDVVEVDDWAGGALAADGGLVAPFLVGVSDQFTGTATTLTPTIPTPTNGDLVIVQTTSRDAVQTMAQPAGEGWSSIQSPSQTGLEDVVWGKIWGLGGQTDDTTPTFTIGSGTAGWGATVTVWRNPAHATAPWTSVAAAVAASASGANASSTTVTAPSATHTGNNRTVVRIVSSADDNDLRSTGAVAYGGVNYDSTTGNDFSQACSVLENITVTTNTGTATFTENINGADVSNGVTLVLQIPASATSVNPAGPTATADGQGVDAAVAPNAGGPTAATTAATAAPRVAPAAGGPTAATTTGAPTTRVAPAPGGPTAAFTAAASPSVAAPAGAPTTATTAGAPTTRVAPAPAGPTTAASAGAVTATTTTGAGSPATAVTAGAPAARTDPNAGAPTAAVTGSPATVSTAVHTDAPAGGPATAASAAGPTPALAPTATSPLAALAAATVMAFVAVNAGSPTAGATAPPATAQAESFTNAPAGAALVGTTASPPTPAVGPVPAGPTVALDAGTADTDGSPPPGPSNPILGIGPLRSVVTPGVLDGTVEPGTLTGLVLRVGPLTGEST